MSASDKHLRFVQGIVGNWLDYLTACLNNPERTPPDAVDEALDKLHLFIVQPCAIELDRVESRQPD